MTIKIERLTAKRPTTEISNVYRIEDLGTCYALRIINSSDVIRLPKKHYSIKSITVDA